MAAGSSEKNQENGSHWRHNGCSGRLIQLNKEPVGAGEKGSQYLLFRCSKCGETVLVG